jgi:molybdate transport system substrate-binding protein
MTRLTTRAAVAGMIAAATLTALAPAAALAADKPVLVVLAASSAKGAVADFVEKFQKKHPEISVQASYAGSKVIAAQVKQGAAADVLVIADPVMQTISGDVDGMTPVVRDHTTVIVSKSASAKIHTVTDLVAKGVRLGSGTPGSVTEKLTDDTVALIAKHHGADFATKFAANVTTTKSDLGKLAVAIASGNIDAAIAFPSNIVDGQTTEIALAPADRVEETYDVAVVKATKNGALAKDFAAFMTSAEGAAIFRTHHHESLK